MHRYVHMWYKLQDANVLIPSQSTNHVKRVFILCKFCHVCRCWYRFFFEKVKSLLIYSLTKHTETYIAPTIHFYSIALLNLSPPPSSLLSFSHLSIFAIHFDYYMRAWNSWFVCFHHFSAGKINVFLSAIVWVHTPPLCVLNLRKLLHGFIW